MSTAAPLQTQAAKQQPLGNSARAGLLLQRKCACGSATSSLTGECAECKSKKRLQAKLTIGATNDPLEQEADRVAEQVMAVPAHSAVSGPQPRIQRYTAQASEGAGSAPASVDRVLAGSGRPLEPALQQNMERRFGYDFSRVRVHSGAAAEQSTREVNANAYTVGHNVVFGASRLAPSSNEGRRLIAHELTHVVQQTAGGGVVQSTLAVRRQVNDLTKDEDMAPERASSSAPTATASSDSRNYESLAEIIHRAIYRLGTDEEAVYQALGELNREQAAINKLKSVYSSKYPGKDLVEDIRDDFSGSELEYALQLISLGDANSLQRIEGTAGNSQEHLARAAKRLHDAFEIFLGTDEEAVYATLLPFNRDAVSLGNLRTTYQNTFHEDLKARIFDEFSGSELEYVLFMFLTPQEAYEYYLKQAAQELSGGVPGGKSVGDQTIASKDARYDRAFWESDNPIDDKGVGEKAALRLRQGTRPSEAVQAMYDSMSQPIPLSYLGKWRVDCGEWVQVHHLYAMLKVLGSYRFDERFGGQPFWFKSHRSTGLKAKTLYTRLSIGEKMKPALLSDGEPQMTLPLRTEPKTDVKLPERDAEELLNEAPIGSRVGWFNQAILYPDVGGKAPDSEAQGFANENSIKLGPDQYGAHGFGPRTTLTRRQIAERSLSYGSNPKLSHEENIQKTVFIGEIEIYQTVGAESWKA